MGDRTGLTRLDRTNGFDDGRDYMKVKKSKLALQNEEIQNALRNRHSTTRSDIFKGISFNVNGRTQPTADELKRIILLNGGEYHPYYRYQTTKFMIATNLSTARVKNLRPDDRIVKPKWITDSVQAKCLLPYEDYQIFADEPRGKTGSTLAIDSSSSSSWTEQPVKAIRGKADTSKPGTSSDQPDIRAQLLAIAEKSKADMEADRIEKALCQRINSMKSDLFKGISVHVISPTQPTADELKRLILLNGGEYHPFYKYQTTKYMIATSLSASRLKTLRPDDKIVRPEWITDSVQVECLLPFEDYQISIEESQDKTSSKQDQSTASSSNRKSKKKVEHPVTKSRDIRDFFFTQL